MNITRASLNRPTTTLMVFICFVAVGIISSRLLPLEFMPDFDNPYIWIGLPYPGSTPAEVEQQVTRPAEEALATITDIKHMRTDSREHGADILLEFNWGIDANIKALEVKERLDGIRHLLPDDLERYQVQRWSPSDMEILTIRISSNRDLSDAYEMLDRNLKRRLNRIDGVSKINLYGLSQNEIRIQLLTDRIIAHRIDINRLVQNLRNSNFLVTAGKITDMHSRFVVRPMNGLQTVEDIGDIIVAPGNIRLKDVADIMYGHPALDYGRHLDRRFAIGLDIYKESGANTVEVTNRILEEIDDISALPEMEGISIFYLHNMADGILNSLNDLLQSGLLGALFAICVLYFFLRRISTTLIVTLAVPFSILITMAFMYFAGISLNILSMMGLMLAIGMLVDNAVVVTESIHRHQLRNTDTHTAVIDGVKEVALAITAGTLTTAIVFLPNIVSVDDQVAVYMKHVSITICIALGASLLIAQTVVPLFATKIKPPRPSRRQTLVDKFSVYYMAALQWTLNHRKITIGLALVILTSVALPAHFVKMNMFDEPEGRKMYLSYHINGTYTVSKVEETVNLFENYLFENQDRFEFESVYSYYNANYALSTILLKEDKYRKNSIDSIRESIRKGLPKTAIADPSFEWHRQSGEKDSVNIQLTGESSEKLVELSHNVAWVLSRIPGFKDVRSDAETGDKEIHVVVDRIKANQYGFSTREIATVVSAAMRGISLPRFRNSDREIPMTLEFHSDDKQNLQQLQNVPLLNRDNQPVPLSTVADFRVLKGPRTVHRENRKTSLGVTVHLQDLSVNEARKKLQSVLDKYEFPPGYSWSFGQSFRREDEAAQTMLMNLLLALVLIYFLMASLFESLVFPAAIWTQILFAVVGVYWFFMVTGTTMSIMGMIGILILIGVVVNNGIVLVDFVNQLRARGHDRRQAILRAGQERFRPILMTAGTTVLSMIPLCIGVTQVGGEGPPYYPMARAIVGGLAFSTLVTLIILPTIYVALDDLRIHARKILNLSRH